MSPPLVSQRAEWHSLQEHYQQIKDVQMRDLFAQIRSAAIGSRSKPLTFIWTIPRIESQMRLSGAYSC